MKILLIPDSFKGGLSASRLCALFRKAAQKVLPEVEVKAFPAADGGEGTLEALQHSLGGALMMHPVTGPCGQRINARYLSSGETAYIEMAEVVSLKHRLPGYNAANTTTFGVGELMRQALDAGHRRLVLTLGGSCTGDCGCGMAAALGTVFIGPNGRPFIPTGESLHAIKNIRLNPFFFQNGSLVVALCDVTNPLYGPEGAAQVYGSQKGSSPEEIRVMDDGARHLAQLFAKSKGPRLNTIPGGGAAGGAGAGAAVFLNAGLGSGTEAMLGILGFEKAAAEADVIITGEGCTDNQTAAGKLVAGVAKHAGGKPVIVISGQTGQGTDLQALYDIGVTAVFPTVQRPCTQAEAMSQAAENVEATAENVFRLVAALKRS